MLGLSPAQISQASAQDQQMFGQILNAIQNQQQLKLSGRKQTLAEQQFGAVQEAEATDRQAIERLRKLTPATIDQASAADLATINKASIGTMLSLNARLRAGQNVNKSDAPREARLLAIMKEDPKTIAADGDITQSDLWKVMTTGKNRAKSDSEIKQALVTSANKDPLFTGLSKEEQRDVIENQLAIIRGETEKPDTGDPLLDSVFEEAENKERQRMLDIYFEGETPL